jgi:hypothetical protein
MDRGRHTSSEVENTFRSQEAEFEKLLRARGESLAADHRSNDWWAE